jgi:hypothetical protein
VVQAPDRHIDARTRGNGEIERRDAAELKALQGKEAIYWLDRVDPSNCLVEREGEYQAEPKRGNVMKRMSLGCSFDRHVLKQRRNATFAFTVALDRGPSTPGERTIVAMPGEPAGACVRQGAARVSNTRTAMRIAELRTRCSAHRVTNRSSASSATINPNAPSGVTT